MNRTESFYIVLFLLALWGMGSMESQIKELKRKVEALEKQLGGKNLN